MYAFGFSLRKGLELQTCVVIAATHGQARKAAIEHYTPKGWLVNRIGWLYAGSLGTIETTEKEKAV
jgi:hypothetical protein